MDEDDDNRTHFVPAGALAAQVVAGASAQMASSKDDGRPMSASTTSAPTSAGEDRLSKLRKDALSLISAERDKVNPDPDIANADVGALEKGRMLWWFVAHQQTDPTQRPPLLVDQMEGGYFRLQIPTTGQFEPVGVFWSDDGVGGWIASRGFRPVQPLYGEALAKVWQWIYKRPVSYKTYTEALEKGSFPNPLGIGGNNPPEGLEGFKSAATEHNVIAGDWLAKHSEIADDAQASAAASLRDDLLKLFAAGEAAREAETQPLYKKWKEALARWAFLATVKDRADRLRKLCLAYADKERRRREDAAREKLAQGTPLSEIAPVAPVRIEGKRGAMAIRTKMERQIEDWDAARAFWKDKPEYIAAVAVAEKAELLKLVRAAAAIGIVTPGSIEKKVAA